jgi:hypothetical protein
LGATANVRAACDAAGVSRPVVYAHRARSQEFAAAWDVALEDACDRLEMIALERARSVSDTLLIFLLKAHRPAKYRERWQASAEASEAGVRVVVEVVDDRLP